LICAPFTTRFLNADPAAVKDELNPEAWAVATPRTTSAVTSPLTTLTPADSATLVSVAVFAESTVLVLEALTTFALRRLPPGGGTATLSTWLLLLAEPTPDCELQTPSVQVAGVAAGSVWLIPKSVSDKLHRLQSRGRDRQRRRFCGPQPGADR